MRRLKTLFICLLFTVSLFGSDKFKNNKDSIVLKHLDSLRYYLDKFEVQEPIYVMSQALWESGWFRCKNCTWENNNMFGFRGQDGKYMKFNNWIECVQYYADWQKNKYKIYKNKYPSGDYYGFLKWVHYAEYEDYISKIKMMHKWILSNWIKN